MSRSLFTVRGMLAEMTPADGVVSIGVLALSFFVAVGFRTGGNEPTHVVARIGGEVVAEWALADEGSRTLGGRRGPVDVEVRGGAVRVVRSGCPQKICVGMGPIRRSGELIACVPNALTLELVGGTRDPDAPDAVSR